MKGNWGLCCDCDCVFCLFSLVTVAVLRAAAMGSPRVGATASSLAMVDSSKAMDSSKAIIPLRAMDSRTSTTAAVVAEVEVRCLQLCLQPIFFSFFFFLRKGNFVPNKRNEVWLRRRVPDLAVGAPVSLRRALALADEWRK